MCSSASADRSSLKLLSIRNTFGDPLFWIPAQRINSVYHNVPLSSIAPYADSWARKLGVADVGCVTGTGFLLLLSIEAMTGGLGGTIGGRVGGRARGRGRVGGIVGAGLGGRARGSGRVGGRARQQQQESCTCNTANISNTKLSCPRVCIRCNA